MPTFFDLSSELRTAIYGLLIFDVSDYTAPHGLWVTQPGSPFTFCQMLSMYICPAILLVNQKMRHEYASQVCTTKQNPRYVNPNSIGFVSHREIELRFDETPHHDFILHAGNRVRDLSFYFNVVCPLYYPRPPIFLEHVQSVAVNMVSKCALPDTLFENDRFNKSEYDRLAAIEIRHMRFSSYLPSFLQESFKHLKFARINLHLWGSRFTFSWLRGELNKLRRGICNLNTAKGTELLISVVGEFSRSHDDDFQLLAKSGPVGLGWTHVGETTGFNKHHDMGINENHRGGFRHNCFQCWIDRRAAGAEKLRLARRVWIFGRPFPQLAFRKERIRWD